MRRTVRRLRPEVFRCLVSDFAVVRALALPLAAALWVGAAPAAPAQTATVDYDVDDDGLIEIATLARLDAVRHDLDGDGAPTAAGAATYAAAFPDAAAGMGCDGGCAGYELTADLDFDTDGSGAAGAGDAYWNGGAGWTPIGDVDSPFDAIFEGQRPYSRQSVRRPVRSGGVVRQDRDLERHPPCRSRRRRRVRALRRRRVRSRRRGRARRAQQRRHPRQLRHGPHVGKRRLQRGRRRSGRVQRLRRRRFQLRRGPRRGVSARRRVGRAQRRRRGRQLRGGPRVRDVLRRRPGGAQRLRRRHRRQLRCGERGGAAGRRPDAGISGAASGRRVGRAQRRGDQRQLRHGARNGVVRCRRAGREYLGPH